MKPVHLLYEEFCLMRAGLMRHLSHSQHNENYWEISISSDGAGHTRH